MKINIFFQKLFCFHTWEGENEITTDINYVRCKKCSKEIILFEGRNEKLFKKYTKKYKLKF